MSITTIKNMASASTIAGQKIYNAKKETLGKVEDVVLDLDAGKVAYVVLSFGGFLGIGDKLFAVPLQALTADSKEECFHLDITKEKLENAPGFDKSNWPTTYDESFMKSVYSHYGIPR